MTREYKIDDEVRLREDSPWNDGDDASPLDTKGVVVAVTLAKEFPVAVAWEGLDGLSLYHQRDLDPWVETPDREDQTMGILQAENKRLKARVAELQAQLHRQEKWVNLNETLQAMVHTRYPVKELIAELEVAVRLLRNGVEYDLDGQADACAKKLETIRGALLTPAPAKED